MSSSPPLPSSWEELPPDLLGLVLLRLPSLADRVRLRAVCRPWRAGARLQRPLPPPLPWLALRDGTLVDLCGNPVRCAPILREGDFGFLAVDNLAFVVHGDGSCSLMNPISGSVTPLPKLLEAVRQAIDASDIYTRAYIRKAYAKVILSSPLDSSPDPLIASVILEANAVAVSTCKRHEATSISLYPEMTLGIDGKDVADIAFLCGKLYTLSEKEGLHHIKLDAGYNGVLSEPEALLCFHKCIGDDSKQRQLYGFESDNQYFVDRYLVESHGRLFMVRRWMSVPRNARLGDMDKTRRFEVFEADLTTDPGRWVKVDNLGGNAVFLGSECSKSVCASKCSGGVQEDCIYFMHRVFDNPSREYFGPCVDPLGDSGIYNMKDGTITPLLPEAVMEELRRKHMFLTWFFPADV